MVGVGEIGEMCLQHTSELQLPILEPSVKYAHARINLHGDLHDLSPTRLDTIAVGGTRNTHHQDRREALRWRLEAAIKARRREVPFQARRVRFSHRSHLLFSELSYPPSLQFSLTTTNFTTPHNNHS